MFDYVHNLWKIKTIELAPQRVNLPLIATISDYCWIRNGQGIAAWGTSWKVDTSSHSRFTAAQQAFINWKITLRNQGYSIQDLEKVRALGSFTFSPNSKAKSSLFIPTEIVVKENNKAWVTFVLPPENHLDIDSDDECLEFLQQAAGLAQHEIISSYLQEAGQDHICWNGCEHDKYNHSPFFTTDSEISMPNLEHTENLSDSIGEDCNCYSNAVNQCLEAHKDLNILTPTSNTETNLPEYKLSLTPTQWQDTVLKATNLLTLPDTPADETACALASHIVTDTNSAKIIEKTQSNPTNTSTTKNKLFEKVVIARKLTVNGYCPSPNLLLWRLQNRFPECWTFHINGMVGATPELLLGLHNQKLTSHVLAGSCPPEASRIQALVTSTKDLREHKISVKSVATALEPLVENIEVPDYPVVQILPNVAHLASDIQADTQQDAFVLLDAIHPSAAVGGVPTDMALDTIEELEGFDRRYYAGPVGWVDGIGDTQWGITLRCAEIHSDYSGFSAYAGCGLLSDSDPSAEEAEINLKFQSILQAIGINLRKLDT